MYNFIQAFVHLAHANIARCDEAVGYLYSRGVKDEQILGLNLGYVPEVPDIKPDQSADCKKFLEWSNYFRRLVGSVVLPVHDMVGNVVGLQCRSIKEKQYCTFISNRAKHHPTYFGTSMAMDTVWATKTVFIVEGPFDWFPVQHVLPNTLCTLGVIVSNKQLEGITRVADTVVAVFDADDAAKEAYHGDGTPRSTKASLRYRTDKRGIMSAYTPLPGANDPSALWDKIGEAAFKMRLLKTIGVYGHGCS